MSGTDETERRDAAGEGPKVLIADDSDSERERALDALREAGYRVVSAIDGQQALEVFGRERPDLVLLDVVMPRLTGLEACRILKAKAQGRYLPVILVSTRNTVNARVEGLRSGADDYLGKPYDAEELKARVEALLRTRAIIQDEGQAEAEEDGAPAAAGEGGTRTPSGALRQRMQEEFDRAERYSDPLACLRIELDGYEEFVARAPKEEVGVIVDRLRDVIEDSVRKIDIVFRADDRGYLLVLPNTHFPGALAVAERIARDVRKLDNALQEKLSVSVGVSFFPNKDTHSLQDLLDLVEAALQRARAEGKGRICLFQHQGYLYAPDG